MQGNGQELTEKHEVVEDTPIDQIITEEFIAKFEKQADLYQNRYLPVCFKLTNEADWVSHGQGRFYLQCSGAEKLCNPLGIVWDRPVVTKHEREDEHGKYYEYEVEGVVQARVLKRFGWFTGNCSSRDKFFNARGDFDEGDIRKAAFSNWLVNAVTRLAGVRNPTAWILRKAGLNPENISSIDYSGANKGSSTSITEISDAQIKRLMAIARGKGWSNDSLAEMLCQGWDYIAFVDSGQVWDVCKQIKRGDYNTIVAQIEKGAPKPAGREPGEEG